MTSAKLCSTQACFAKFIVCATCQTHICPAQLQAAGRLLWLLLRAALVRAVLPLLLDTQSLSAMLCMRCVHEAELCLFAPHNTNTEAAPFTAAEVQARLQEHAPAFVLHSFV